MRAGCAPGLLIVNGARGDVDNNRQQQQQQQQQRPHRIRALSVKYLLERICDNSYLQLATLCSLQTQWLL